MDKEHKSFRISPDKTTGFSDLTKKDWWKYKKLTRKEYGVSAVACLLISFIMPRLLATPFFIVGIVAGIIWIYKTITHKD